MLDIRIMAKNLWKRYNDFRENFLLFLKADDQNINNNLQIKY